MAAPRSLVASFVITAIWATFVSCSGERCRGDPEPLSLGKMPIAALKPEAVKLVRLSNQEM